MLLRVASDIHMERFRYATVPADIKWDQLAVPPRERDSEAVLVLAGDICEFGYAMFFASMWKELSKRFKAVVYIPGNHEYCGPTTPYGRKTFFYFKELFRKYGNIHLLDDKLLEVAGRKIYGTSLWSNYDNNPVAMTSCAMMYDFRYGLTDDGEQIRPPTPQDYVARYVEARQTLEAVLGICDDLVVVSHFAPSRRSIHPRYAEYGDTNFHFTNELDVLIMDSPQIKLWIHGHTHTQFDYVIGQTRVVCNPTGFDGENTGKFADLDYIEV